MRKTAFRAIASECAPWIVLARILVASEPARWIARQFMVTSPAIRP
jgi:hypothetical protein